MPHTAARHGRQVRITGQGRRGLYVETLHRGEGAWLGRGWIRSAGIRDGHTVWHLATYDHVHLDSVCGDFVDAERVLLDATTELDN